MFSNKINLIKKATIMGIIFAAIFAAMRAVMPTSGAAAALKNIE